MSKDPLSKIRANDTYRFMLRALGSFGVERHEVVDERPHPKIRFFFAGAVREFHFAGTPSSFRTPKVTEAKLRRFLRALDAGEPWQAEREEDDGLGDDCGSDPARTDAQRNPIVILQDGEALADSRDVAAYFGKEHKRLLQTIRELHCSDDFRRHHFVPFKINDLAGESTSHVMMTKNGFVFLAMGFTGEKAGSFKEQYIAQFDAMEAELRRRPSAPQLPDFTNPVAAARAWADEVEAKLLAQTQAVQLQAANAEMAPKVEAYERLAESDGSFCITDAAKTIQVQPKALFKFMRAHGWIYARAGAGHDVAYQSKLAAGLLEHKTNTVSRSDGSEKTVTQVRVTPKGLARLAKEFPAVASAA